MSAPASDCYPVLSEWAQRARMNRAAYESARTAAGETPDAFWSEQSRRLDWMTTPTRIKDVSFEKADFRIRWLEDGVLNVAWNCLDRHLAERGDETAVIWEGDDPAQSAHVRKEIGPIAAPDVIHRAPGLPKTRSGKIMRRILRTIAEGERTDFGDISTLADPSVVALLAANSIGQMGVGGLRCR